MCPICRTGILNRVVGKQLFGIPHTDFYIECTHCGAKFIPVGTQFRLVSIATVRIRSGENTWTRPFQPRHGPLWHEGPHREENRSSSPAGKKPVSPSSKFPAGGLTQLKDGSLVVPYGDRTLYFKPVKLDFYRTCPGGLLRPGSKTS